MSLIPQRRRAQSWVEQIPVGWIPGQMWCPSEALLSESESDNAIFHLKTSESVQSKFFI